MTEKYKLISEITPGQTNWTAKVIVAEKSVPRIAMHSPTKYQNMLLIDAKGNKVQATIYAQDIQAFQDKFQLSKTYLVSNAQVKFTKPQYRAIAGDIQWTINGRTRVEELDETHTGILFSTYKFVPFDKLQDYMDRKNSEISIYAVVIDMRQKRQIQNNFGDAESTIQEIFLINQRFEIAMLTMWDNFVEKECNMISNMLPEKPIIIGTHLKVTSFHELSISTKSNSSFLINPHFQEILDLKSWVNENMDKLNDIITEKSYLTSAPKLSAPPPDQLATLNKIQDMLLMQTFFWVKVRVNVKILDQPFWYMSCDKCNKISNSNYNEVYECIYCKTAQARATPRARVDVELQDSSGSIKATVVGQPAEKLLQCSAKTLMEKTTMNQPMKLDEIIQVSSQNEFIIYLKATKRVERNTYDYKYNIISVLNSTPHSEQSTSISNVELVLPQTSTQAEEQFQIKAKKALFLPSHSDEKSNKLPLKGVFMEDDLPKKN